MASCFQSPAAPPEDGTPQHPDTSTAPVGPDVSALTSTAESEHFVFHFEPGDTVEIERSEAYHNWAVAYLGVTPPKKVDFYKYPTSEALQAAVGKPAGGVADPPSFAVYTFYSWHPHECFHLYASLLGLPPMFFNEGFAVANEFDPYNNDWVARHNRTPGAEPYIDMVRHWRGTDSLYDIQPLLASSAFSSLSKTEAGRLYPEAGMFVSYLVDRFGVEKMKELFRTMHWTDSVETASSEFLSIFGLSVREAQNDWYAHLDSLNDSGAGP